MNLITNNEIAFVIVIRILCLGLVRTYDYPDQYWQGSQISYKMAYGYGYQTWQWTLEDPIRNPLYALYLSLGYQVLKLFEINNDYLLDFAPWVLHSIFAILADIYLIKTIRFYYQQISFKIIIIVLTNWYYLGTMSRTYYNSLESSFTLIGFYYWLTRDDTKYNDKICRALAIICYWVRPTSLLIWAVVWPYELILRYRRNLSPFKFILKNLFTISIMLGGSLLIGTIYYGKFTLTELSFIKYNIILKWSELFGKNNFGDYLYKFIPFILHIGLVFLLYSCYLIFFIKKDKSLVKLNLLKQLVILLFISLLIASLSTHKQVRFLLIYVPFLLIISVMGLQALKQTKKGKLLILLTILINIFLFLSLQTFGKTGGIQTLRYLRQDIDKTGNKNVSLIQLGEQHFIPLYSILHRDVKVQLPDSSAVAMAQNRNENLLLNTDPLILYDRLTQRLGEQPNYIIAHGLYHNSTKSVILNHNYKKLSEFRNCHIFQQRFNGFCDTVIIYKK